MLRPPPTPGPYARDFEAYYAGGATWSAGGDAWSRAVWRVERTIAGVDAGRDELLPYVGPAAALPLFGAFARLPFPLAQRLWSGSLALALGVVVVGALVLARARRVGALLAAFTLALVAGPVISDLALGQVALLSAAGIVAALVAYEHRVVAGGALATLAAGVQPNLALALVARMRDRTALVSAAIGGALFAVLTLAAGGGVPGVLAYLHRLGEHGRAERFVTIQHTPAAIAWAFGAPASAASLLGAACALGAIVATAVVTLRARLDARDGTLLALAALPFAVPFFHEHDFAIELLAVIVLGVRASGAARAWAGVAAAAVLVDWFGLAQRAPAQPQLVVEALAVAAAFAALGAGRLRRADAAPAVAALALAALALPLARAHPAPTWPEALGAAYRAPANADASAVWADEQRVSGLDARDPAWGILRTIPLAGCVALGIAITLHARKRHPEPVKG